MSEPIRDVDKGNNNNAAETAAEVGAILAATALEAAKTAMLPPSVRMAEAAVGGAIAFGAIDALTKAAKQVEKGAQAAGGALAGPVGAKVASEVVSTPADVRKHFKENPLTASLELVISPISVVADAKFRKWFGK